MVSEPVELQLDVSSPKRLDVSSPTRFPLHQQAGTVFSFKCNQNFSENAPFFLLENAPLIDKKRPKTCVFSLFSSCSVQKNIAKTQHATTQQRNKSLPKQLQSILVCILANTNRSLVFLGVDEKGVESLPITKPSVHDVPNQQP